MGKKRHTRKTATASSSTKTTATDSDDDHQAEDLFEDEHVASADDETDQESSSDPLAHFLNELGLSNCLKPVVNLGVTEVGDLALVTENDLTEMGLNRISARKFMIRFAQGASSVPTPAAGSSTEKSTRAKRRKIPTEVEKCPLIADIFETNLQKVRDRKSVV